MDIAKLIRQIRLERGITQDSLAEALSLTKQTVSNYERGIRVPSYETLEAIADVLNVPMSFFLSKEEQEGALNKIYEGYQFLPSDRSLTSRALRIARVYDLLPPSGQSALDAFADFAEEIYIK